MTNHFLFFKISLLIVLFITVLSLFPKPTSSSVIAEDEGGVHLVVDTLELYTEKQITQNFGFEELDPFLTLIKYEVCGKKGYQKPVECDWTKRNNAQNPHSTAYGIGQFLNSTWKLVGCEKTDNPFIQVDCMIKYVEKTYGTPSKAVAFHNRNNWY